MNKEQLELNKRLLAAAKAGDAAELGRLLDARASALARDEGSAGECALIHVCRIGSLDCVRLLLEHGANVNSTNFYTTPLMTACRNGHVEVARHLVEQGGADVNQSECEDLTALNYAAYSGSIELVDLLLDHGADIDNETWEGTALARVCRDGDERMGLHLLARGADPLRDPETLGSACKGGSLKLVQAVLDAWKKSGRDYVRELREDSPLEAAVAWADKFNPEVAQLMYDHGFRFDGMHGEYGWWNRHGECADDGDRLRWLRAHGAFDGHPDPLRHVSREFRPVVAAAEEGGDALQRLIDAGCDVNAKVEPGGETALCLAFQREREHAIGSLLDAGADAGVILGNGENNLLTLPRCGEHPISPACLARLCRHGADPDFHASDGKTPLLRFIDTQSQDLALALLRMNVDIEARNEDGCTPFLLACKRGMSAVAKRLAEMGCDTAAVDAAGNTALMLARDTEIAMLLLDLGARADVVSNCGRTAMHCHSDPVVLQRLLELGCPLDRVTDSGEHAIEKDNAEAIRFFLQHGVNPNIPNAHAFLVWLVTSWNVEAVDALVRAGMDVNTRDSRDLATPLHEACRANDKCLPATADILRLLLEAGADANARDEHLQTPLMKLCLQCEDGEATPELVRILLQHGADPALETPEGWTAEDFAQKAGLRNIVKLLRNAPRRITRSSE